MIFISCCEGYFDKDEKLEEVVKCEFLEEIGYELDEIVLFKGKRSFYSIEY